jgi:hypothetical protein
MPSPLWEEVTASLPPSVATQAHRPQIELLVRAEIAMRIKGADATPASIAQVGIAAMISQPPQLESSATRRIWALRSTRSEGLALRSGSAKG